jgi:hypothetical protein
MTFRDVADPYSVEPLASGNLEKTFGGGARIDSVTLAITDEPVTHTLEQHLPWLAADITPLELLMRSRGQIYKGAFEKKDPFEKFPNVPAPTK